MEVTGYEDVDEDGGMYVTAVMLVFSWFLSLLGGRMIPISRGVCFCVDIYITHVRMGERSSVACYQSVEAPVANTMFLDEK